MGGVDFRDMPQVVVHTHRVAYVQEAAGALERGKYLDDDQGRPAFLVDPGVCGTLPYRLAEASGPAVV